MNLLKDHHTAPPRVIIDSLNMVGAAIPELKQPAPAPIIAVATVPNQLPLAGSSGRAVPGLLVCEQTYVGIIAEAAIASLAGHLGEYPDL